MMYTHGYNRSDNYLPRSYNTRRWSQLIKLLKGPQNLEEA